MVNHTNVSRHTLYRARVQSKVAGALTHPVAVLHAPAGYGKSIALADALESSGVHAVRYTLNSQCSSAADFMRGLAHALEPIAPAARLAFAGAWARALESAGPEDHLVRWLHAHLEGKTASIVVDQLHHAYNAQGISTLLTRLADLSPRGIRWVFAGRGELDLAIPRWLADGRMAVPIGQDDLQFSAEDVAAAAELTGASLSPEALEQIREHTGGWPAGVMFALRSHFAQASNGTFIVTAGSYATLAEHVFDDRSEREREFLLVASLLPELEPALCQACGFPDAPQLLEALASDAGLMFVDCGRMQFHDWFAAFLNERLRSKGRGDYSAAVHAAAAALERADRFGDALRLALQHRDRECMTALLDRTGLQLLQGEDESSVQAAIAQLGAPDDGWSAQRVALKAVFESRAGRFDTADSWFSLAIERAGTFAVAAEIAHRYASEMLSLRRAEVLDVLERYGDCGEQLPTGLSAAIESALATAYVQAGQPAEAAASIARALAQAERFDDGAILATVLTRAAFVAYCARSAAEAQRLALGAAALAESSGLFSVACSACSTLYALAADRDDVAGCLAHLRRLSDNAAKAGNAAIARYGLMAMYELEAERADPLALQHLRRTLQTFDVHYEAQDSGDTILPSHALELAGCGRFAEAYRLLLPSTSQEEEADRIALRNSEIALYAAAAADTIQARTALLRVRKALRSCADSPRAYRAKLFSVLTLSLLGRGIAVRLARAMNGTHPSERAAALYRAVRALVEREPQAPAAVAALRQYDCGGFAAAFSEIPALRGLVPHTSGAPKVRPIRRQLLDEVDAALNVLVGDLEQRDALTGEHSRAVSLWCARLARKLGMHSDEILLAARSGLVHDVGKLLTPREILNAPRSLSSAEWEVMRAHALAGEQIVLETPVLAHLRVAVRSHHERLDGKGYPDGLRGLQIPEIARLVTVADCFNAMIGRRPYRKAMPPSVALLEMERHRGTQFDPEMVDALIEIVSGPREQRYA